MTGAVLCVGESFAPRSSCRPEDCNLNYLIPVYLMGKRLLGVGTGCLHLSLPL